MHSPLPAEQPLLAYATSMKAKPDPGTGAAFRDQELLIALTGTTLPDRCILCGQGGQAPPVRLTFTWDASFMLTRESTLQLRQKATIHAFLCSAHRDRWRVGRMLGLGGSIVSFAVLFIGLALAVISESSSVPWYTPAGVTLMTIGFAGAILSLFFFTFRTRTVSCQLIRENYVYLDGAAPEFLESLPPLPRPAAPAKPGS